MQVWQRKKNLGSPKGSHHFKKNLFCEKVSQTDKKLLIPKASPELSWSSCFASLSELPQFWWPCQCQHTASWCTPVSGSLYPRTFACSSRICIFCNQAACRGGTCCTSTSAAHRYCFGQEPGTAFFLSFFRPFMSQVAHLHLVCSLWNMVFVYVNEQMEK